MINSTIASYRVSAEDLVRFIKMKEQGRGIDKGEYFEFEDRVQALLNRLDEINNENLATFNKLGE